jgi:hypothetical protein
MSEESVHAAAPVPGPPRKAPSPTAIEGDDALDGLLARAEDLADTPLPAHADVFEQIHTELERRLREADA